MTDIDIKIKLSPLEARMFFDDHNMNDHPSATEQDCAQQASQYIDRHGVHEFIREWELLTFGAEIWVGNTKVYEGIR